MSEVYKELKSNGKFDLNYKNILNIRSILWLEIVDYNTLTQILHSILIIDQSKLEHKFLSCPTTGQTEF